MADIQKMFYSFTVREDHRNYFRFLCYKDTDFRYLVTNRHLSLQTTRFRRRLQKTAETYGDDFMKFVQRNFYVDDALVSVTSSNEAVDLL